MGKKNKQAWKEKAFKKFWINYELWLDKKIAMYSCKDGERQVRLDEF